MFGVVRNGASSKSANDPKFSQDCHLYRCHSLNSTARLLGFRVDFKGASAADVSSRALLPHRSMRSGRAVVAPTVAGATVPQIATFTVNEL